MKKISIKQAIINAIDMTEPDMGRHMNFLIKQAKYIEKEIGSVTGMPVAAKASIVNGCEMEIPHDCFAIIALLPGNYEEQCNAMYLSMENTTIHTDDSRAGGLYPGDDEIYRWMPLNSVYVHPRLWREYGDVIHLVNQYQNQEMTIIYQKFLTDTEGMWLVNESHIDAITKFLIFKYAKKFQFRHLMRDKMIRNNTLEVILQFERDYSIAVRNARAEDGKETPYETSQY